MKDLSVNNILISGQSPVVQGDIGGDPNQIPLNKDLGSLAYQDAVNLDDVSADMVELHAIAAEISDSAVDVFVYDTSRDSDGGAWRKRTQHTSWYNEELNTATRGARREFPVVAVIVAEADKVTIYDGDDPDMGMWMVFNRGSGTDIASNFSHIGPSNVILSSIHALNSQIFIAGDFGSDMLLFQVKLINDHTIGWFTNSARLSSTNISKRNANTLFTNQVNSVGIISTNINDVAMTVLPNAPIDDDTGLPVPTIAVATDGGVSVIKDDGTVVDSGVSAAIEGIIFNEQNNLLYYRENTTTMYFSSDYSSASFSYDFFRTYGTVPANFVDSSTQNKAISFGKDNQIIVGSDSEGISRFTSGDGVGQVGDNQVAVYTTSRYNTGWMPGDIKLAALSDSVVENVGVSSDELVTNGDFSSDTSGWSGTNSATLSVDNQRLKIQGAGSSYPTAYTSVNVVEGIEYEVSAEYISNSNSFSGRIRVSSSNPLGGDIVNGTIKSAGTTHVNRFTASSTGSVYIALMLQDSGGNSSGIWDNISVRATTELITNGDFSTDVTATDGQTSGGWTSNKASLSVEGGRLKIVDAGSSASAYQAINTIVGQKYTLSLSGQFNDGSDGNIQVRDASFAGTMLNSIDPIGLHETPAEFSLTFVAESSTSVVRLTPASTSSFTATFDNVSVRPAEEDRSVNDNGLQIIGEINKTPVAPGADLVAYSGFSENNYLIQPYNADLDFGTGDFCVMGWVNQPAGQTSYLFDRRSGANNGISMSINTGNLLYVSIRNGTSDSLGGVNFPTGSWVFMSFVRRDGIGYIYINGILLSQGNLDDDASEDTPLVLGGISYLNEGSCKASLALFRISATAPTDAQIAKIYRDEKPLFSDGAQATLYSTSDAVTALAYDQKTELLHVGTSAGRSDFSGLRRINNTTTAITTSISAHNNLIAEQ
jgi:hypothetical protein